MAPNKIRNQLRIDFSADDFFLIDSQETIFEKMAADEIVGYSKRRLPV